MGRNLIKEGRKTLTSMMSLANLDPISRATSKRQIAPCLYLMNKMQRNIIKKRRWAIFRWVSLLNRFSSYF